MNTSLFSAPTEVIAGLVIGLLFGFLLQKAHVTRFTTIVGQLRLKDFTVMKVIMTAIASGSFFLYLFTAFFPETSLIISTTTLFTAALGGAIFGVGMAVLGYCPGTCIGALAERAKDALCGVLGLIVGAALYAEIAPWIKETIKPDSEINKTTLPEYFAISPWVFISGAFLVVALFLLIEKGRAKTKVLD